MTTITNSFTLQMYDLTKGIIFTFFTKCKDRTVKKSLYRRTCHELQSLDDRILYDIGINRGMIKEFARIRVARTQD